MDKGFSSLNNGNGNPAKEERISCLIENKHTSGYSAIKYDQDNNEGESGLYLYDCYYLVKKKLFPQRVKAEAKVQLKLAGGICANMFVAFFIPMTMLFVVGHKGQIALAAAGLGLTICNVTGHAYVLGITSVCETFFSQAYGAKQLRRYGIILQRATILTFIAILPSCALWINIDIILLYLGQDKEVAKLAGQFTMYYIQGIFCFILYNLLLRYLACQHIVYPTAYSGMAAFIVNGLCCYVFLYICDLGVGGGALALDFAYLTYCVVLLIFIFWKKLYKDTWHGWSYDCLCEWKQFITLSAASLLLFISEWVCFEVGIIALGAVGSLEQAVQVVLFSIAGMIYYGSSGFSIAAAVRVGQFIGSGEHEHAKVSMRVSLTLASLTNLCVGLFMFALHDVIGYMFTSDRSVVEGASKLVYLVAIVEGFDCLEVVCGGVVRGLGYQKHGAIIYFVSFLCIGTLAYMLLIFKANLGVLGYWIGIMIAIVIQTVALFLLLYITDWKKLSVSVREKVGIVEESTFDGFGLKVTDDGSEADSLKLERRSSINYPANDCQKEDTHLITETTLSHCVDDDQSRHEENRESNGEADASAQANQDSVCDVFIVYQPPQFSKVDILIKVSVISFLFVGVMVSAVFRLYL